MRGAELGAVETASYESSNFEPHIEASALGVLWVAPRTQFHVLRHAANIGRSSACEIHLQSEQVSRHHAVIQKDGPLWLLKDQSSKNGTWVNGRRHDIASLNDQDTVRLGDCVGVICAMPQGAIERGEVLETLPPGFLLSASTRAGLGSFETVAQREIPILVYGETGTGKDALARAIHDLSRRSGAFVAVNCAAIPEAMAEALLFGHRKGAFTGAQGASDGFVRAANGGTLFLDEIADLPLSVQGKLLRALEEHAVTPLGATQPIGVDFRVVAACQEPLDTLVEESRFRQDLHARLRGIELSLPALRRRRQEVVPLLGRFLDQQGVTDPRLDPRLVEALCMYDWPYNTRELQQLAGVLAAPRRRTLTFADLPERMRQDWSKEEGDAVHVSSQLSLRRKAWLSRHLHELLRLRAALEKHRGNVTSAALEVGLPRHRARRLLAAEAELIDAGWR